MKEKKSRDPTGRQRLSPQRHAAAMPVLKLIINKHTWSPRIDEPEMFWGPRGNTVMQQGEREEEKELRRKGGVWKLEKLDWEL